MLKPICHSGSIKVPEYLETDKEKMPDVLLCLQTFSKLKMLLKMFRHFQKAERREVL